MPFFLWIALGVSLALLVAAGSFTAARAARAWTDGRELANRLTSAATDLAGRTAALELRAERLQAEAAGRFGDARRELQDDLDTLAVLTGELRSSVGPFLALTSTK